jgi:hypothetical protein
MRIEKDGTSKRLNIFQAGQTVITIKDEEDIELIPAGTEIKLTTSNGEHLWYGRAVLNKTPRSVLVRVDNLMETWLSDYTARTGLS